MKTLLALLTIATLTGCAHERTVIFDSDPRGAVVEFDGTYLGKTPLEATVSRERNEWSNKILASEVTATKSGCVLTKKIGKDVYTPTRMFFDFTECKAPVQATTK